MTAPTENTDREPDIVLEILQRVRLAVPTFTEEQMREIELQVRANYGGMRVRVAKRKKHLTRDERRKAVEAAMTEAPTSEVLERSGISRATLYRYFKRDNG